MSYSSSSSLTVLGLLVLLYYGYTQGLFGKGGTTTTPAGGTPPAGGGGGGGSGTALFAAVGDIDDVQETATALANSGAGTILIPGDLGYDADPQEWWDGTMAPIHSLNVYAAQGNHDGDEYTGIIPGNNGAWEFTLTLGSIGFICVNTEAPDEAFLTSAIEQFQTDTAIKMIIPWMHIPVRTPEGSYHGAENTGWHSIFTANPKVKVVINAHNHNMSVMDVDGIKYVCNGAGGRDLPGYPCGSGDQMEFCDDTQLGILIGRETGTGLSIEFVANGGGSVYSLDVPFPA